MKRAVIYARYSTDLQNERSIDDQIALCQAYADREGISVVTIYEDRAISGAAIYNRPGLINLLAAANNKAFDIILVEALDRLSRDMADLAQIHKQLGFLGVELVGLNDGGRPADTILVALRGLVGQLYREDGAKKVRRGMTGVVTSGRHAGGRPYGYRPIAGKPGELEIYENEAETIRWIFAQYAAGWTPRQIVYDLNARNVPPPRGTSWNASTLNGSPQRAKGILQNEIYVGRLVWNKVRMVKDPKTGKRVSRPNPQGEWVTQDAPHLRIVTDEAFQATGEIKSDKSKSHPSQARKTKRLLSGLLRCGCCGSGMSAAGTDKSKKVRI